MIFLYAAIRTIRWALRYHLGRALCSEILAVAVAAGAFGDARGGCVILLAVNSCCGTIDRLVL